MKLKIFHDINKKQKGSLCMWVSTCAGIPMRMHGTFRTLRVLEVWLQCN